MIFPQAKFDWYNPLTCFDRGGYTTWFSQAYLTNKGPQMKALKGMLDRVTKPRDSSVYQYTNEDVNLFGNSAA